ncbi:META domain-containing protein [Stutzerimonas nosocomialis]|uniref:META domain-containing protein n=1 Tax=Stutzerimonas nosocomialis TaxID=1056496 RepID=UPI0039C9C7A8
MRSVALALSPLVFGLGGCATEPTSLQENLTYAAEWIGDEPVIGRTQLTLVLSEGRAYGNGGCNHWFGSYVRDGEQLRFSELGSTRRACGEAIMAQERRFLDTLGQVQRWDISNLDQLRLWPAQGAPIRLWPAEE